MPRPSRREVLLDAAGRLVQRHGAEALTLEAVGVEAGTSKGGVLYHFPSKSALLQALVQRLLDGFERRAARAGGDLLEGFVRASVQGDATLDATATGLIAVIASSPTLLEPLRERFGQWEQELGEAAGDDTVGLLLRLALDGLWFADLFGLAPPSRKRRQALGALLLSLSRKDEAPRARRASEGRSARDGAGQRGPHADQAQLETRAKLRATAKRETRAKLRTTAKLRATAKRETRAKPKPRAELERQAELERRAASSKQSSVHGRTRQHGR